jgi:hypothetical protein
MKVPDKFPSGTRFHGDKSGGDWVEFPDGKVFKLDDNTGLLVERRGLPLGSLQGSIEEATFIRVARDLEASATR